jgi:hypothetical protein
MRSAAASTIFPNRFSAAARRARSPGDRDAHRAHSRAAGLDHQYRRRQTSAACRHDPLGRQSAVGTIGRIRALLDQISLMQGLHIGASAARADLCGLGRLRRAPGAPLPAGPCPQASGAVVATRPAMNAAGRIGGRGCSPACPAARSAGRRIPRGRARAVRRRRSRAGVPWLGGRVRPPEGGGRRRSPARRGRPGDRLAVHPDGVIEHSDAAGSIGSAESGAAQSRAAARRANRIMPYMACSPICLPRRSSPPS